MAKTLNKVPLTDIRLWANLGVPNPVRKAWSIAWTEGLNILHVRTNFLASREAIRVYNFPAAPRPINVSLEEMFRDFWPHEASLCSPLQPPRNTTVVPLLTPLKTVRILVTDVFPPPNLLKTLVTGWSPLIRIFLTLCTLANWTFRWLRILRVLPAGPVKCAERVCNEAFVSAFPRFTPFKRLTVVSSLAKLMFVTCRQLVVTPHDLVTLMTPIPEWETAEETTLVMSLTSLPRTLQLVTTPAVRLVTHDMLPLLTSVRPATGWTDPPTALTPTFVTDRHPMVLVTLMVAHPALTLTPWIRWVTSLKWALNAPRLSLVIWRTERVDLTTPEQLTVPASLEWTRSQFTQVPSTEVNGRPSSDGVPEHRTWPTVVWCPSWQSALVVARLCRTSSMDRTVPCRLRCSVVRLVPTCLALVPWCVRLVRWCTPLVVWVVPPYLCLPVCVLLVCCPLVVVALVRVVPWCRLVAKSLLVRISPR